MNLPTNCSFNELNDLPVIVFTNSRQDYRISVQAGLPAPEIHGHVEQLAIKCQSCPRAGFSSLVGGVPLPGERKRYLAFRVFDVGEFCGRPHTLGIIVVRVPVASERRWRLVDLMASLPPPIPDSDRYPRLSELFNTDGNSEIEPFKSLAAWEEQNPSSSPPQPFCFGDPPGVCPDLSGIDDDAESPPHRWQVITALVAVLTIALTAILLTWYIRSQQTDGVHPVPGVSTSPEKKEIQRVLLDSGIQNDELFSPSANPDALAEIVITTGAQVSTRVQALAGELAQTSRSADYIQKAVVGHHLEEWKRPLKVVADPLGGPSTPSDSTAIRIAIDQHKKYQKLLQIMERISKLGSQAPELSRELRDLQTELQT